MQLRLMAPLEAWRCLHNLGPHQKGSGRASSAGCLLTSAALLEAPPLPSAGSLLAECPLLPPPQIKCASFPVIYRPVTSTPKNRRIVQLFTVF